MLCFITCFASFAQSDYYWVGGGGNWSDYENHWATSSGGSTFHGSVPTLLDNVFFDDNSFSENEQIVALDKDANCLNFKWDLGTHKAILESNSIIFDLNIYGSIEISDANYFESGLYRVRLYSDQSDEEIDVGGNLSEHLNFYGSGEWTLTDSLAIEGTVTLFSGSFHTNDFALSTNRISISSDNNQELSLGSSNVYLADLQKSTTTSTVTIDAGTSTIYVDGTGALFELGGYEFYDLVINNDLEIEESMIFNDVNATPGVNIILEPGTTQTFTSLELIGTDDERITLETTTGDEAIISVSSGTVHAEYLKMEGITATGGATFNAYASSDLGNNSGWNFLLFDQEITFDELEEVTYGDDSFELEAVSSAGLSVSFVSSDESVVEIEGTTVTIVGAGSTTITASQEGNNTYDEAEELSRELIVNKADQSIIFDEIPEKSFGDNVFTLTATSSAGLEVSYSSSDDDILSIEGDLATINGAGIVTITAFQEGDNNHNAAPDNSQEMIISTANQTITFDELQEYTYEDEPFELVASSSAGLSISFTSSNDAVASVEGSTVTINGAGEATLTAIQPGNVNYSSAQDVEQLLVVNKADQEITFGELDAVTTSDDPFSLEASSTSGLSITFSSSDESIAKVEGSTITLLADGTTTITASQEGDDNYTAAVPVSRELLVEGVLGVDEMQIAIFPNPASTVLYVETKGLSGIDLYDFSGKLKMKDIISSPIDIKELSTGIYFLKLKYTTGEVLNKRFLKK